MKFKNKKQNSKIEKNENDIEIVMGDNSNLDISDVGDCVNEFRPKKRKNNQKLVIPKTKKN